jgi:hypothetical protein
MPDPAAAPMETDAEAAGTPPTVAERALEATSTPRGVEVRRQPLLGGPIYLGLALSIGAVIVWVAVFGAR